MTRYLQIGRKTKESKEIDPFGIGELRRNPATIALAVSCLRHRGFDRVSAAYRARCEY